MSYKKDEDEGDYGPFLGLDKTSVLQEARIFNQTGVHPRKVVQVLTKVLFLLNHGENLGTTEATEVFFAITKLFQSKDFATRRLMYLAIKELSCLAEDVIIVTSSLMKDMTGKEDLYRASAIRALCKITDPSMVQGIERYLKQAIVDRSPAVCSSAIVSSLHLLNDNFDVMKRWAPEVQEALNSKHPMVQYHGLGLLYMLKNRDRLAINKLVVNLVKGSLQSPFAICLLIRYALLNVANDDYQLLFDFLEICLRHRSDMVIFEAARAICCLPNVTSRELTPAISVLQIFLASPKPTFRFAAVKTLSKVAMKDSVAVSTCNLDLENLITDSNRSIATLAITTLLKTGSESSVDRLMNQISGFMSEISDDFKVVVVGAIKQLCIKFPQKQLLFMGFLSNILRDEGGFEYKRAIVETMIHIIHEIPEAQDSGLAHLCEFIEDCEFTSLSAQVLHLLGIRGPKSPNPSKYIRYIYNRVILENSTVRAAAVSALAKFGALLADLRPKIKVLLTRCLYDNDDEVRDRAAFYLHILSCDQKVAAQYIIEENLLSIPDLEKALLLYKNADSDSKQLAFNLSTVPFVPANSRTDKYGRNIYQSSSTSASGSSPIPAALFSGDAAASNYPFLQQQQHQQQQHQQHQQNSAFPGSQNQPAGICGVDFQSNGGGKPSLRNMQEEYSLQLSSLPQFASYGPLFKSSKCVELTEAETEYSVNVVKHIFTNHIVFQFNCTNTMNDQFLENVAVQTQLSEDWPLDQILPIPSLPFDVVKIGYVSYVVPSDGSITELNATVCNTLKFLVKDCDPNTGEADEEGYDDEYVLEEFEISTADFIQAINFGSFTTCWEELGDAAEMEDTFELSNFSSLEVAVENIIGYLGMLPCENSHRVPKDKNSHVLLLSGVFRGGCRVMARCRLGFHPSNGVTMQLTVRSEDVSISELITAAVG
eukprot:Sdes_comp20849_c0_seq1m17575